MKKTCFVLSFLFQTPTAETKITTATMLPENESHEKSIEIARNKFLKRNKCSEQIAVAPKKMDKNQATCIAHWMSYKKPTLPIKVATGIKKIGLIDADLKVAV